LCVKSRVSSYNTSYFSRNFWSALSPFVILGHVEDFLFGFPFSSMNFLCPVIDENRMRTGSVSTSSMMHTTHNLVWLILAAMTFEHNEAANYISGDMNLFGILFYVALNFIIWGKMKSRRD